MKLVNEFEKRHAAAAVSRKFGLPADAVAARDPLAFWGVTALTDRSLEPGLTLPGPLRCPCPAEYIKRNGKGTML